MPATKLRREQLNISLNDLLWLDRQKVGGNVRKLSAGEGEDIKLETNNGGVYLLLKGDEDGDIKIGGTRTIVEFFNAVKFHHSNTPNIGLNFSFNTLNFEFQIYSDSEINNLIIAGKKITLYSLDNALEISNDGFQNYVKVNNKLGVGLTPTYTLDVNGDVRAFGDLLSSKTSEVNIGTLTNQPVRIITNNTTAIYITSNGNVGIGTTTPAEKMQVAGNVNIDNKLFVRSGSGWPGWPLISLAIGDDDTGLNWVSDGNLAIYTNYFERVRINSSGNVGIGTTAPNYKLDVNGDIRCFGDLLSSKVSSVNIGTLTNQAVRIITNNIERVIIPTTGYIDFKLPVKMNEGIVVDWEKRENLQILNQDPVTYWVQYNSTDHGVNGWGSWNTNGIGKVFRFMDTGQVIVLLNGQVLTEGSVINGNIVDGDYVFVNAVNSPIENGKALVLAEQPQTGDVVRVIGFFSVYEY
jgi:hypothetical protein